MADDIPDHAQGGVRPDPAVAEFVRGAVGEKARARLAEAVPGSFCTVPDGLAPRERQELTYRRLRRAGLAAPPPAELLEDPPLLCALLERAAVADPALFHVMLLHYTLALGPVLRFGEGLERSERDALESFDSFGTLLMTELGRSNSHLAPRTLARHDPGTGGFVLDTPDAAAAKFPTNTAHPHVPKTACVYATLVHGGAERGVFVFVVPLRGPDGAVPPGVRIFEAPDTTGLPVDYAAVRLEGLRVPESAWLRDGARIAADGTFHDPAGGAAQRLTRSMGIAPTVWRAVIGVSAALARASSGVLVAHSAGRTTLGRLAPRRPLTDYRNAREAVLGSLADAYALTAVAAQVTGPSSARPGAEPDGGAGGPATAWAPWSAVDRDLALLKAASTTLAQDTVSRCRVHAGAPGFTGTDRLNAYRGLMHAYMNAGGDNELILFDTARGMADGDGYRPPEVAGAAPDGGDLLSPEVWVHMARSCERRMCASLAAAVRGGGEPFKVWNAQLGPAAATATALADRTIVEVVAGVARHGPGPVRELMAFWALEWMQRRAGVLLDAGVAAPGLLERVWRLRGELGERLAPQVAGLAAAFDLPAEITAPVSLVPGAAG